MAGNAQVDLVTTANLQAVGGRIQLVSDGDRALRADDGTTSYRTDGRLTAWISGASWTTLALGTVPGPSVITAVKIAVAVAGTGSSSPTMTITSNFFSANTTLPVAVGLTPITLQVTTVSPYLSAATALVLTAGTGTQPTNASFRALVIVEYALVPVQP